MSASVVWEFPGFLLAWFVWKPLKLLTFPIWGPVMLLAKFAWTLIRWFEKLTDKVIDLVADVWQPTSGFGKKTKSVTLGVVKKFKTLCVRVPGFPGCLVPGWYYGKDFLIA